MAPTATMSVTAPQRAEIDPAAERKLIAALNRIDPDLVHGKPDKALSRARDTCSSVESFEGQPKKLVGIVQRRWTSPDHPEGRSLATARKVLKVVRKYVCP